MNALILRYVLRPLGLACEIRKPSSLQGDGLGFSNHSDSQVDTTPCSRSAVLRTRPEPAEDKPTHPGSARFTPVETRWNLQQLGLRAGWYMLEIEHSLKSIGCILTTEVGAGQQHHMLLTSKPVCKRIIRLVDFTSSCLLSVDLPDCSLARVTFKRLSANFADRRMRQRLSNRGHNLQLDSLTKDSLYNAYNTQVHDGIFELPYRPKANEYSQKSNIFPYSSHHAACRKLMLVSDTEEKDSLDVDDSIHAALHFARQCGWQVEWQRAVQSRQETYDRNSQASVFIMPIFTQTKYRIDIFHQMLNAVDSDNILIYADHDHVDKDGVYHSPVLKPEWNPDLLLSMNYIQLPWMISAPWALQVLELSEADDMKDRFSRVLLAAALGVKRCVHESKAIEVDTAQQAKITTKPSSGLVVETADIPPLSVQQVKRIPDVLASAHASLKHDGITVFFDAEYWYQQVKQSLSAADLQAEVVRNVDKMGHRISWSLPSGEPSVDIIIPTRDKVELLQACIESVLKKTNYKNYRLCVVDNDSLESVTQDYYRSMATDERFNLLNYSGNFNYSAINNFAVQQTNADVIVLLNNDTEVIEAGWLDELVRQASRPQIGCVGAKLYYSNGRIQHGGVITGITGVAGHAHRYSPGDAAGYRGRLRVSQNYSAVTAACLAVRRSVWLQIGGLDEENLGVAWNDVDFCLKVQAHGYRNLWTPHAELYHHEGLSRGADDTRSKIDRVDAERRVMMKRWHLGDFTDPAYHPLLTRDNESFTLGRLLS